MFSLYCNPGYNEWYGFSEGPYDPGEATVSKDCLIIKRMYVNDYLKEWYKYDEENRNISIDWKYVDCIEVEVIKEIIRGDSVFDITEVKGNGNALLFETDKHYFKMYQSCYWNSFEELLMIDIYDKESDEKMGEVWLSSLYIDDQWLYLSDLESLLVE